MKMTDGDTRLVDVVFSNHRPETLDAAAALMQVHEAIILEEPETAGFADMLTGVTSIADYLEAADFEFPEFERRSCTLLRRLHGLGKQLYQVDPFMARLDAIHRFFEAGGSPQDIDPESEMGRVYAAERRWSAALLANYEHCPVESFAGVVALVQHFARADAARGRLRDGMRAAAIAALAPAHRSIYVEAGSLHVYLVNELARHLAPDCRIRPVYLLAPVVSRLSGRRQTLGPGDRLTLVYTYRPDYAGPRADLLAARSVVHSAIVGKEEMAAPAGEFPHTRNEVQTNAVVERLTYEEAKRLYGRIMGRPTDEAFAIARRFVAQLA